MGRVGRVGRWARDNKAAIAWVVLVAWVSFLSWNQTNVTQRIEDRAVASRRVACLVINANNLTLYDSQVRQAEALISASETQATDTPQSEAEQVRRKRGIERYREAVLSQLEPLRVPIPCDKFVNDPESYLAEKREKAKD